MFKRSPEDIRNQADAHISWAEAWIRNFGADLQRNPEGTLEMQLDGLIRHHATATAWRRARLTAQMVLDKTSPQATPEGLESDFQQQTRWMPPGRGAVDLAFAHELHGAWVAIVEWCER